MTTVNDKCTENHPRFKTPTPLKVYEGFFMSKIVRIPSRLYHDLFMKGDDKLVAVYCILKDCKGRKAKFTSHKSKNNKTVSHYGLLRKETPISLINLKKYIPVLIEMGLLNFEPNGDVTLIGNEASKEMYDSYKLVPIEVVNSVFQTAYRAMLVRAHSKQKSQQKEIFRKQQISVHTQRCADPISNQELRESKKFLRRNGKASEIITDVVLSNIGYAGLKVSDRNARVTKQKGFYWKSKLKSSGLIRTERRFKKECQLSFSEFITGKNNKLFERHHVYKDGYLQKELVSLMSVSNINTF